MIWFWHWTELAGPSWSVGRVDRLPFATWSSVGCLFSPSICFEVVSKYLSKHDFSSLSSLSLKINNFSFLGPNHFREKTPESNAFVSPPGEDHFPSSRRITFTNFFNSFTLPLHKKSVLSFTNNLLVKISPSFSTFLSWQFVSIWEYTILRFFLPWDFFYLEIFVDKNSGPVRHDSFITTFMSLSLYLEQDRFKAFCSFHTAGLLKGGPLARSNPQAHSVRPLRKSTYVEKVR